MKVESLWPVTRKEIEVRGREDVVRGVLRGLESADEAQLALLELVELGSLEEVLAFELHLFDRLVGFLDDLFAEVFRAEVLEEDRVEVVLHLFHQVLELLLVHLVLADEVFEGEAGREQLELVHGVLVLALALEELLQEVLQHGAVLDLPVHRGVESRDDAVAFVEHLVDLELEVLECAHVHFVGLAVLVGQVGFVAAEDEL